MVSLPPRLRTARPAANCQDQPVQVRIHYMVGNHDWFYHLPGPAYDKKLRRTLVEQMGLANRPEQPFPHDIREDDNLLQAMRRHKVTARHGDIFDPLAFEGDRDAGSLSDALVIDLLGRFAHDIEANFRSLLPADALVEMRELEHLRPILLAAVWLDGLLERTCPEPALRKRVKLLWDRLADEFLAGNFLRSHDHWKTPERLDGLARALRFSKRPSSGWGSSIMQWLHQLRGASSSSYAPHALGEADFRNRRAKHVVYGHTHAAECVPLDASYAEGYVLEQMYFNAGTWRARAAADLFRPRPARVHRRRRNDLSGLLPGRRAQRAAL